LSRILERNENLMPSTLIIGCGYTGQRIATGLVADGAPVSALVRSASSASRLAESGIETTAADLDAAPLPDLPLRDSRVFYLAPPPDTGTADTRMLNFLDACAAQGQPARILYFSTTGVYGDCGGDWVDEDRPLNPGSDRARRRADAEARLRAWHRATGGELVILRVAGIYGPGRLPLERLRKKLPLIRESEAPFTNRIHVDDLAAAAVAAMKRAPDGSVFNASDGHPSTMNDYFNRIADLTGLPRPPVVSRADAAAALSPGMMSYMQESRRLSNRALTRDLGLQLAYPTLEVGLPACLEPADTSST
jgi:nucleoside-diphosphate-sugar epimerase